MRRYSLHKPPDMLITFSRLTRARAAATCLVLCLLASADIAAGIDLPFVTTWNTNLPGTSDSKSITIPTSGDGYLYDVDWNNDGIFDTLGVTGSITHEFLIPGIHTIAIRGEFPQIRFDGGGDAQKLVSILFWGDIRWRSMESAFRGCKNLLLLAIDAPDLSGVTSMNSMFQDCERLNSFIHHWNTGSVTDMGELFMGASNFNKPLNDWDVSQVTNFSDMFMNAHRFDQDLRNWNVEAAVTMRGMFAFASSFNGELGYWNTGNVTDMTGMFRAARTFNRDLNRWETGNVVSMARMFEDADNFNGRIDDWDVAKVTNFSRMFQGAKSFNRNIGRWKTDQAANLTDMFRYTLAFNQDIGDWNTASVEDISGIFYSAKAFDQDISRWDVSKVKRMKGAFAWTIRFNRDLSRWDVSAVRDMSGLFWGSVYDQDLRGWNISRVTDMTDLFKSGRLSQKHYDELLLHWSELELQTGVRLDMGTTSYCVGATARQRLIDAFGWIITDGGSKDVAPTAVCRDITVYLDASGRAVIKADTLDGGSFDGCGQNDLVFAASRTEFTCADVGRESIEFTVTDPDGNVDKCTAYVTVEDGPIGIYGMPENLQVVADRDGCSAVVTWNEPTTNCRATLTSTHASGDVFPLGTTVVSYMASESSDLPVLASFVVTVSSDLSAKAVTTVAASCSGAFDGAADVQITGGTAPYGSEWLYAGGSSHDGTGLPAGQVLVTVSDAVGCQVTTSAVVDTKPVVLTGGPKNIQATTNTDDCRAVVTWEDPVASCSAGALSANYASGDTFPVGTTRVTYTYRGEEGESARYDFTVTVRSDLRLAVEEIVSPTCYGSATGQVIVGATGGISPYAFDWQTDGPGDFDDAAVMDTLRAGAYEIFVRDSSGCVANATVRLNEPEPVSLTATAGGTEKGQTIDLEVSGGTAPYSSVWTGNGISGSTTDEDIQVAANGIFTVDVSDSQGCTASLDVEVDGLPEICTNMDFDVYPNPTSGQFFVRFARCAYPVPIRVYGPRGNLIVTTTSEDLNTDLDFSSLTRGLYYIRVDGRYEVHSRTVLIY